MKKANKALLVALLGAGLTLASCGGTETSSSTPAESTTTSASSEAEASSETHGESSSESVSLPDSSDTSSTPDVVEDYLVDIVETTGVHITSNLERAKPGDTVTLTVTVDPGYVLTSLTMNGETLAANGDGTYSFTMPDRDAKIRATVTVEGEVTIGGSVSAAFTENGDGTWTAHNVEIPAAGGQIYIRVSPNGGTSDLLGYSDLDIYKCFGNITYYYSSDTDIGSVAEDLGIQVSEDKGRGSLILLGGNAAYDITYDPAAELKLSVQRTKVTSLPTTSEQLYSLFDGSILSEAPTYPAGVTGVDYYDSAAGVNGEDYHYVKYADGSSHATVKDHDTGETTANVYKEIVTKDGRKQLIVVDNYLRGRTYTDLSGGTASLEGDSLAAADVEAYSGRYDVVDTVTEGYSRYQYDERDAAFLAGSYDHTMREIDMVQYQAYRHSFEIADDLIRTELDIVPTKNEDGTFTVTIDSLKEWNPSASGTIYNTMDVDTVGTWHVEMTFTEAGAILNGSYLLKKYTATNYNFTTHEFIGDPETTGTVLRELRYSYTYGEAAANPHDFDYTPYFATSIDPYIEVTGEERNVLSAGWDSIDDEDSIHINPSPSTALDAWQYGIIGSDNPDICRNEDGSPTTYQMYGTGAVTLTFGNHTDNSVTGSVEVTIDGSTFHSLAWIPYYEGGIYSDENILTASNLQIYGNSSHTVTLSPTPNNGTLFGLEWTSDHEGLIDLDLDAATGRCTVTALKNVTETTTVNLTFTSPYIDNVDGECVLQVTVVPGTDEEVSIATLAGTYRVELGEDTTGYDESDPTVLTLTDDPSKDHEGAYEATIEMFDEDATFKVGFDYTYDPDNFALKVVSGSAELLSGSLGTYDDISVSLNFEVATGKVGVYLATETYDWSNYGTTITPYLGEYTDDEDYSYISAYVFFVKVE